MMDMTNAGDLSATLRAKLANKPKAALLLWRLSQVVLKSGRLRFTVADSTAVLWFADHGPTVNDLTRRIDHVAETYDVDVTAVASDGTVLYRRMVAT